MTDQRQQRVLPRIAPGAVAMLALLSGCADMSGLGGNDHFACKAPPGVQCNSVSGNYANALQNNLPFQRAEQAPRTASVTAPQGRPVTQRLTVSSSDRPVTMPLRSPARVQRLWVKAWEDQDHDLVDQSYVYIQVEEGRWLVEHAQAATRDAFAPLRTADRAETTGPTDAAMPSAPAPSPAPDQSVPPMPAEQPAGPAN